VIAQGRPLSVPSATANLYPGSPLEGQLKLKEVTYGSTAEGATRRAELKSTGRLPSWTARRRRFVLGWPGRAGLGAESVC